MNPRPVTARPDDELVVGDRYYILASSVAADLPKLVLKHDDAFLVADRRGDFPALPGSEFGFYADGTRFLHPLELRVHGRRPLLLNAAVSDDGLEAAIDLTNPDIAGEERIVVPGRPARATVPGRVFRIRRLLTVYRRQLYHTVSVESFAREPHALEVVWRFGADFADVFDVRGYARRHRGLDLPAQIEAASVALRYRGLDDVIRTALLRFDPAPDRLQPDEAVYVARLEPGERLELALTVTASSGETEAAPPVARAAALGERRRAVDRRRAEAARIETDHRVFDAWVARGRADLHLLLTETPDGPVPDAGIPWYVAPFGRDSLLTALEVLPFEPEIARGTLRFLARHQAAAEDAFTDAEPGKILHEYRRGELAACREIPFIPYYGSVDATPLFLVLLGEYVRWTGDFDLARELWPAAERALAWMEHSPLHTDGFLRYHRQSRIGLEHQGWKDSADAIMHASGEPAKPPIAVVEAQGYQFAALLHAAWVARRLGHRPVARRCRARATRLQKRFEAAFWMPEEGFYALALDGQQAPCRVITSNPGHCLWAGVVSPARAEAVASRLLADDMFTGWGLRTLSARERLYNPMSYHNGSVWPHDTALAAAGMARYGLVEPFMTLTTALFQAVHHVDGARLPELFCGFPRAAGHGPTRYPVACSPQAWAAGVVFLLVSAMLGFEADATENRLTLHRPRLPAWLGWLEIRGLRLARSRLDLRVTRGRDSAAVELLARTGDAEIVVRR
ncbi:MAG TPA: glycogen debranching N-terminal domain-containing protein [Calidithermus sp.]|nr:glycogen debranching N-terminal domain-containing protein [Calidithermus sp.]